MAVEQPRELAEGDLTDEQRKNLELLNGQMPELLRGFDEVLAGYGIERQVYRFSTRRIAERDESDRCPMCCCACGPPDEACAGCCPHCVEVEAVDTGQADEVSAADLTDEQRKTLDLLNDNMMDLLRGFDEVLARYDIERQVHQFTTVRIGKRDDSANCMMMCCRCPPPDEACECSSCDEPVVQPE